MLRNIFFKFKFIKSLFSGKKKDNTKTYTRYGVQKMVSTMITELPTSVQEGLPYNFANTNAPYSWERKNPYHKYWRNKENDRVEQVARFCGWFKALMQFSSMQKIIKKTMCTRGMNSPYTTLDVWDFQQRFPSPHRAIRVYLHAKRRANEILSPYGVRVSYHALAKALCTGDRRPHKMAKRAAADTLRIMFRIHGNESDNEILIAFRGLKKMGGIREFKNLDYPSNFAFWTSKDNPLSLERIFKKV